MSMEKQQSFGEKQINNNLIDIQDLKLQIQSVDRQKTRLQESMKAVEDEKKNSLEKIEDKYRHLMRKFEDELKEKDRQMRKIQQAHQESIKEVEMLMKSKTQRLEELKKIQVEHCKNIHALEKKQWQVLLAEKEMKYKKLEETTKSHEKNLGELNKKLVDQQNKSRSYFCLLLIASVILVSLLYHCLMVMGFEIFSRDAALAYQQHAHKRQIEYIQSINRQEKRYLEDKSKGCSIM